MRHIFCCLLLVSVLVNGSVANAAYLYSLTQTASEIDLQVTGTSLGAQLTVSEQNPTARTRYNGTVATNFHLGVGANSAISFPDGGGANAVNPLGLFNIPLQYSPNVGGDAGTAAANYGVNLSAPQQIVLPPFDVPNIGTLNLGTITAVDFKIALRELQLDPNSPTWMYIDPITRQFNASLLSIDIANGFADVNGSLRMVQPDILSHFAAVLAVNALVASVPDIGLTVTSNVLQRSINVGFGTRIDMSGVSMPNTPLAPGSVTYNPGTLASTLTIPVLADFGDINLGIGTINLKFAGQLRGTASIPNIYHIPEPSSLALAAVAGAGALVRRRRRSAA
ncbi:MAG: PEP-CTERM sorting domain-containing protein [Pirellulaceae bacterium]|nr:PEP-CTERM sorting domain-containing protein [Pirellulaceae bacterium]